MKQPPPATPDPQKLTDPSLCDADGVVQAVGADLEYGLTSQDAVRRLEQDGPNELRATPVQPAWRRILAQFEDPLVYLRVGRCGGRLFQRIQSDRDRPDTP